MPHNNFLWIILKAPDAAIPAVHVIFHLTQIVTPITVHMKPDHIWPFLILGSVQFYRFCKYFLFLMITEVFSCFCTQICWLIWNLFSEYSSCCSYWCSSCLSFKKPFFKGHTHTQTYKSRCKVYSCSLHGTILEPRLLFDDFVNFIFLIYISYVFHFPFLLVYREFVFLPITEAHHRRNYMREPLLEIRINLRKCELAVFWSVLWVLSTSLLLGLGSCWRLFKMPQKSVGVIYLKTFKIVESHCFDQIPHQNTSLFSKEEVMAWFSKLSCLL